MPVFRGRDTLPRRTKGDDISCVQSIPSVYAIAWNYYCNSLEVPRLHHSVY